MTRSSLGESSFDDYDTHGFCLLHGLAGWNLGWAMSYGYGLNEQNTSTYLIPCSSMKSDFLLPIV